MHSNWGYKNTFTSHNIKIRQTELMIHFFLQIEDLSIIIMVEIH